MFYRFRLSCRLPLQNGKRAKRQIKKCLIGIQKQRIPHPWYDSFAPLPNENYGGGAWSSWTTICCDEYNQASATTS